MPFHRYTQAQLESVYKLLGVGRPLAVDQRCVVQWRVDQDILGTKLVHGVVVEVLEHEYAVLVDGRSTPLLFPKAHVWNERSPNEFQEIVMLSVTNPAFVSSMAYSKGIKPPSKAGKPLKGRPKGSGPKKLKPRSPYRDPAFRLFDRGKKPLDVVVELGITRAYAYRFHGEWTDAKKAGTWPHPSDGTNKNS